MLTGKNILVCISGGIAAYKAADIVSKLRKSKANVNVIMTEAATNFITPMTLRELSCNPVVVSMWEKVTNWNVEHIALASKADLILIAPATANIIGKLANGIADDMLTTTVMATKAPVYIAPAMNTNMYQNQIVQDNITKLSHYGYNLIEPESGMLACGIEGLGRLPEPEKIVTIVKNHFKIDSQALKNKKILITAGGTIEPLDPIRYIGNRSSGKMGYAIAKEAVLRGAEVVLVSGPTALPAPEGVRLISIETAAQMRKAVLREFNDTDITIKAAAVADYHPRNVSDIKIKKSDQSMTVVLEKNPDILMELGSIKTAEQLLIGFAAETNDLIKYAKSKVEKKNLDMIIANDVSLPGAGFNSNTNIVKILYKNGTVESLEKMSKHKLASIIIDKIISLKDNA